MLLLVALAQLVLAAVFVVSAVAKLRDREDSRDAVRAFGVPAPLVPLVSAGLPWAELACAALLLVPGALSRVGAVASLVILVAFTIAIIVNLALGRRPECRCFGSMSSSEGISWMSVARNGAFIVLAAVAAAGTVGGLGVVSALVDLEPVTRWTALVEIVLVGAVAVLAWALWNLVSRYGSVLNRLEAIERLAGLADPVDAPDFALADLDGSTSSLADALAGGRPAMVVFVSPTCHNCTALMPDLSAWQNDPQDPVEVVVVAEGSPEHMREKIGDAGPLRVLMQRGHETSDAYEVLGTPAAVVVGVDGKLATSTLHGVDEVRQQHERMVALAVQQAPGGHHHAHGVPGEQVHQIGRRAVAPGDVVPDPLSLWDEEGQAIPLSELAADEVVLLFWRTDCGFCRGIVDDVRSLQHQGDVVIVTGSSVESLEEDGLTARVLRDVNDEVGQWLEVPGTPSAARFRGGRLESLGVGGPEVLTILLSARDSQSVGLA